MIALRGACAALVLLACLCGCGATSASRGPALRESVKDFAEHMRWGRIERAAEHVPEATKMQFIRQKRSAQLQVQIHEYDVKAVQYAGGMTAATRHLCESVSKSMTSALAGALAAAGRFGTETLVTDYVGELTGTVWEGCTAQHLLDMTAGVSFDEDDYDDMDSEAWRGFRALGWLERLPHDPSPAEYVAGLRRQAEHGAEFEYRSICTDVLGWCLERATGRPMAELFSEYIWKPLGAAHMHLPGQQRHQQPRIVGLEDDVAARPGLG